MSDKPCKRFLLISRAAPYGSSAARDLLDVALTCSVFEQPVSLLLLGDALLQLLPAQNPTAIGQKNLNALQASLELYDIDAIYTDAASLAFHGLDAQQLMLVPEVLQPAQLAELIQNHDVVLSI
ncbi:sulfurtransferase complex subunit TusC [Nitrincola iocasae]|jgi:tRNA 2-thiouridine synthesizing protein C|uniref:Sulfurtransferase complex subunit TusC n=1 Tax=Nitrincola iocasae TaxID=2614693 RepID=A0A5J6LE79_9GAMM|nr:sulfurtransferase complex subunit TusC [Nitrincola iocasae]QEW06592.1 sulfurtransferase complex subunit TusC [Nitrincola iocasae]